MEQEKKKHWIFPNKQSLLGTIKLSQKIKKENETKRKPVNISYSMHPNKTEETVLGPVRYTLSMRLQREMHRKRRRSRERSTAFMWVYEQVVKEITLLLWNHYRYHFSVWSFSVLLPFRCICLVVLRHIDFANPIPIFGFCFTFRHLFPCVYAKSTKRITNRFIRKIVAHEYRAHTCMSCLIVKNFCSGVFYLIVFRLGIISLCDG